MPKPPAPKAAKAAPPLTRPADWDQWTPYFDRDDRLWLFHLAALASGLDPIYNLVQVVHGPHRVVYEAATMGVQAGEIPSVTSSANVQVPGKIEWRSQNVPFVKCSDFLRWYSRWADGRDGFDLPEGLRGYLPLKLNGEHILLLECARVNLAQTKPAIFEDAANRYREQAGRTISEQTLERRWDELRNHGYAERISGKWHLTSKGADAIQN